MRTVAVVLNYNDASATLRCVDSLRFERLVDRVLVIDNGSDPMDARSLALGLQPDGARVRLVTSRSNLGFGGGMNLGIAQALESGAESVLLLNNDTLVQAGAVAAMQRVMEAASDVGIVVPLMTTGQKPTIQAAGGTLDRHTLKVTHRFTGLAASAEVPESDVSFAPGAALLVRSDVFQKVGGFTEELFLYFEDVEFSWRVTQAGYRIRLAPQARIWHAVQGGRRERSTRSVYYRTRNSLWINRRLVPGRQRVVTVPRLVARGCLLALQKGDSKPRLVCAALGLVARGVRDGLRPGEPRGGLAARRFPPGGAEKDNLDAVDCSLTPPANA